MEVSTSTEVGVGVAVLKSDSGESSGVKDKSAENSGDSVTSGSEVNKEDGKGELLGGKISGEEEAEGETEGGRISGEEEAEGEAVMA